jgi:hypothetical protein
MENSKSIGETSGNAKTPEDYVTMQRMLDEQPDAVEAWLVNAIAEASLNGSQWKGYAWLLERRWPEKYGTGTGATTTSTALSVQKGIDTVLDAAVKSLGKRRAQELLQALAGEESK